MKYVLLDKLQVKNSMLTRREGWRKNNEIVTLVETLLVFQLYLYFYFSEKLCNVTANTFLYD